MGFLPREANLLPPSDDRVFKLLLTPVAAKPVLMDLISTVIGRPVVGVEVRNNEIPTDDTDEKAGRLDVNCKIDDGSQVDTEMAAARLQEEAAGKYENVIGKSVFYQCDLHASQPAKGVRRYDKLAKTYQITFCTYNIFPERKAYFNSFALRHDIDNGLLTDALHIMFIELGKLKDIVAKPVDQMTELDKWAIFLRYAHEKEYREKVNEIIAAKEVLQMAGEVLLNISKDEREQAVFRSRRMYETDLLSNLATVEDRGVARGMELGRVKGRTEGMEWGTMKSIRSLMDNMGLPFDRAMRILNVPEEEGPKYRELLKNDNFLKS